ncbi:NAD-dependent protein deacetylase [Thalassoglobus neptunius]|uniref:protein acetyllysine N-acetyltransferase n=1 Tax=Thalassoglobus neptunius TaxID=1938619 RepID=A0A5C5W7Y4_9PLAN|nr:Sir2 family NAD-dependent protein deacetylase [Thalassoglobus neptunius]TWT46373.1 NAD-dependent protein deacetylase [Thalassoglobus neptunius]
MRDQDCLSAIEQVAHWMRSAKSVVAFTGAGISTESGIPDFRSPGGVWSKNRTVYFDDFLRSESERHEYWRQKSQTHVEFARAQPNCAHQILARWESMGMLDGVITQNIDGLHAEAGSRKIWELHGTAREVCCLSCEERWRADSWVEEFLKTDRAPRCPRCNGFLKHATVSFGQALPMETLESAMDSAMRADLILALGLSLVVYPAAEIPERAKQLGARLVIINRDPTPLDSQADVVIRDSLGTSLTNIDQVLHDWNQTE